LIIPANTCQIFSKITFIRSQSQRTCSVDRLDAVMLAWDATWLLLWLINWSVIIIRRQHSTTLQVTHSMTLL